MAIGTFGSFTQARLAIYAAQTGLSITGNNISNVNTEGYTRQRLDQGSLHIGGVDRYANPADVRTGQGVLCSGVSQLRDPYLDIRFRSANANLGANDVKLGGLEQIKSILDEVGKGEQAEGDDFGILGAQLVKFWSTIGDVTDQTGHAEYNLQVKTAAESLTRYLRDYSARLQEVYDDAVMAYEEDVAHVNGLLSSIREYNEEIRNCDIHGDKALELRDQRNVLLDELSQYLKINVIYGVEEIAPGLEVEKCTVKLDNANPDPKVLSDEAILIDGVYAGQLSIDQEPARRPLDPTDTTTWPYLDAEEKPVMDAADAAEAVIYNPNYDENDPDNPAASGRYIQDVTIGSDGSIVITSTNDRSLAMPALTPNPAANYTRPNAAGNEWYLNADGEPTTLASQSAHTLEANPDYRPYLNGKDEPVADVKDAKLVNNPNFSLTLSELRNREGYLHYIMEKQLPQTIQKNNDPNAGEDANLEYERAVYFALQPQPITSRDANGNTVLSNYYQSGQDDNGDPIYTRQDFVQILSTPVSFDDNDLHGALQADRELLTEKGEFTDTSIIDGTNENRLYCDEKAATKRGIPYYQRSLDLLANQLAKVMNEANRGYYVDDKGNYVGAVYNDDGTRKVTEQSGKFVGAPVTVQYQTTDADGNPVTATYSLKKGDTKASLDRVDPNIWNTMQEHFNAAKEQDLIPDNETFDTVEDFLSLPRMLKFEAVDPNDGSTVTSWDVIRDADGNPIPNGIFDGGNLFSNHGASDDDTNITASNISVSFSWSSDAIDMVRSFECPPGESEPVSGANGGFLHFQLLANKKFDFVPSDLFSTRDGSSNVMFRGSFAEMYQNIQAVLGNDQKVTKDALNASYQTAMEIDTNRDSVSAVDFNDEAMNLMMYSKSYNAACRLMTTIDSVLDKLINGTGMTT